MQLTQFTDLGLRILMYLNQGGRPTLVTNNEIATQFNVPLNHLIKVTHMLSKLGWITTLRGRHGGMLLNVDPQSLSIATILRGLEGAHPLIDCHANHCILTGHCLLSQALQDALLVFYKHLEDISLADVCAKQTGLTIVRMHKAFLKNHDLHLNAHEVAR